MSILYLTAQRILSRTEWDGEIEAISIYRCLGRRMWHPERET